jgi:hypothetical protein
MKKAQSYIEERGDYQKNQEPITRKMDQYKEGQQGPNEITARRYVRHGESSSRLKKSKQS